MRKLLGSQGDDGFDHLKAIDLNDGSMGSIRLQNEAQAECRFGSELSRAQYEDNDGVLVSITLNIDEFGNPYEMDFWRVDFAPLRRYPSPDQLTLES